MAGPYETLAVTPRSGASRFAVRVKPRSSRAAVGGVKEGALELSVMAPPVDGEANAAVIQAIAHALGVGRREVAIVAGQTGKQKVIEVQGLDPEEIRQRLERSV